MISQMIINQPTISQMTVKPVISQMTTKTDDQLNDDQTN